MRAGVVLSSLALLGSVAGVAADQTIQKRSFKVDRVRNEKFAGNNGPKQLLKMYRKYRFPPLETLQSMADALAATLSNSTPEELEALGFGRGAADRKKGAKGANNRGGASHPSVSVSPGDGNGNGYGRGGRGGGNGTYPGAPAGTNATGTGSVINTPEANDIAYLAPVTIGGQTVNLDFDTGSSDLWVFSSQLSADESQGHGLFSPEKSKTFKEIKGSTFLISYGDGSGAAGVVGTDTVEIGGVTATGQAVELATEVSASFVQDTESDGLLGLAYSDLNTVKPKKQKTFFDTVKDQLTEPVFTADLRPGGPGAYEFGKIDTSKFVGEMAWVDVNTTQGFWQFSTESFSIGGGPVTPATSGGQAIADTGTTLMLADPILVKAYYSQIDGAENSDRAGGYTVPCDAKLPDLTVDVGGNYQALVKGVDINFGPVGNGSCFGGLQPSPGDLFIFGDIFFRSQFVVFNSGNNSLGMAEHA